MLATAEMYDIAEAKWIYAAADADGAARRGGRRRRQHRVLHRRRGPADHEGAVATVEALDFS